MLNSFTQKRIRERLFNAATVLLFGLICAGLLERGGWRLRAGGAMPVLLLLTALAAVACVLVLCLWVRCRRLIRLLLYASLATFGVATVHLLMWTAHVDGRYVVGWFLTLGVFAFVLKVVRARPHPAAGIIVSVVIFLTLRMVLLGNPWAWNCYAHCLSAADIGRRQHVSVREEARRYRVPRPIRLLAVGSSQTGAIYREYRDKHPDFELMSLAGMKPLDYYLYRRHIAHLRPDYVLLYLSDFDMARLPNYDASKLCPPQGVSGLPAYFRVWTLASQPALSRRFVLDMVVGDMFPEYKYEFVFRGMLDKGIMNVSRRMPWTHSQSTRAEMDLDVDPEVEPGELQAPDVRERQLASLTGPLWTADAVPLNRRFLELFVDSMLSEGIRVVIVEGRYHPDALIERNRLLRQETHSLLATLAAERDGVQFMANPGGVQLAPTDFIDIYHTTPVAGLALAERVVEDLRKIESAELAEQ